MVLAEHCQFDVNLREYSENVRLQDRHKDLEKVERHLQRHGDYSHKTTEVQDKAQEDKDDEMSGQDVGVEP